MRPEECNFFIRQKVLVGSKGEIESNLTPAYEWQNQCTLRQIMSDPMDIAINYAKCDEDHCIFIKMMRLLKAAAT